MTVNIFNLDPLLRRVQSQIIRNESWDSPPVLVNGVWTTAPSPEPKPYVSPTPRFDMLRERCNMEWGVAPKYNEAYRKIRWPANETLVSINPSEREPQIRLRDFNQSPPVLLGPFRRSLPIWKSNIEHDLRVKRSGRWDRDTIRSRLRADLISCIRENIPFKTKTLEYKPSDQWLYVNGLRAMKYSIRTGYIVEFTYSGVYNKVTSLMLRLIGIDVKLVNKKLTLKIRPSRQRSIFANPAAQISNVPINIHVINTYLGMGLPKGFVIIDHQLDREQRQLNEQTQG